MPKHEWRDETDEGEVRLVRARLRGRVWSLQARLKSEREWVDLVPPPIDDLHALRDVLERKYRRGRVPHHHVVQLDAWIETLDGEGDHP